VVCTILYIIVVAILNGMVPFYTLNVNFPVAFAVDSVGLAWAGVIISFGAIAGLTTVLLVMMYGQTRIFYADVAGRTNPALFVRLHPTWRTPWISQILFGVLMRPQARSFDQYPGIAYEYGNAQRLRARLDRRTDIAQPPSGDAG